MTAADKLFESLKTSDRLMKLSAVLRPAQMMLAMQVVTAAMANKPAPEQTVRSLLRSFDAGQVEQLRAVLTSEQFAMLGEAINE